MATLEQTPFPAVFSLADRESLKERPDVLVYRVEDEEYDPNDPTTIEAKWDNDPKLDVDVDYFNGVANVDSVRRPPIWGEDIRPKEQQLPEIKLALGSIVEYIAKARNGAIEIGPVKNLAAEAALDMEIPQGWARKARVETWIEGEVIDLRQAIEQGMEIKVRLEKSPAVQPTPSNVYIFPKAGIQPTFAA